MSRKIILTLATAATIAAAGLGSSAADARGFGGGGFGGGCGGGGFSGGGNFAAAATSLAVPRARPRRCRSINGRGRTHPGHPGHPGHWPWHHHHWHWFFRDGRWIIIDAGGRRRYAAVGRRRPLPARAPA